MPSASAYSTAYAPNPFYGQSQPTYAAAQAQPERSYTLGGDNYAPAVSSGSPNPYADDAYYARYSAGGTSQLTSPYSPLPTPSASQIDAKVAPVPSVTTATLSPTPRGPRSPSSPQHIMPQPQQHPVYEDSPPMYDDATAQPPGQWGAKH